MIPTQTRRALLALGAGPHLRDSHPGAAFRAGRPAHVLRAAS